MSEVRVVRADASHIGEIYALEQLCFSVPWPLEVIYEDVCVNQNQYFLLQVDGVSAGYAGMWIVLDEAMLNNICIHPDYRGRGLGKYLLREMLVRAAGFGVRAMTLEVRVSNAVAIELYKDMGFEIDGRRKGYYQDNGEDAYIMWKQNLEDMAQGQA